MSVRRRTVCSDFDIKSDTKKAHYVYNPFFHFIFPPSSLLVQQAGCCRGPCRWATNVCLREKEEVSGKGKTRGKEGKGGEEGYRGEERSAGSHPPPRPTTPALPWQKAPE